MALDQTFLEYAATQDTTCQANYSLYEEYYSGHSKTRGKAPRLTDRARRYLERSGLPFNENFIDVVVDVQAERLVVEAFTSEDQADEKTAGQDAPDKGDEETLEGWLSNIWAKNRMDAKQGQVHTQTLYKGDAFLIVDYDAKRKIPVLAFNRPEVIARCVYSEDNPDQLEWVSKVWGTRKKSPSNPDGRPVYRLNIYYDDRIEKYFRAASQASGEASGNWAQWVDEGSPEWPTPWVRKDGTPRGVPVIHFKHKAQGDMGVSEIRACLPFQDELNKQVIDLADILDYQAWPQRYATGVNKDVVNLKPKPGEVLHASDKDAKFGQMDAANPEPVVAAIESTLSRLARRTRTPMHLLTGGTPPSGEALKTAESGLVHKIKQAQVVFGNSWEDAMTMAIRIAVDLGVCPVAVDEENLVLQTAWADAETRNDLAEAQRAEILDGLGVSKHTIFTELGLDYAQEMDWKAEEKDTLDEAAGNLLDQGAALNGQVPPPVVMPTMVPKPTQPPVVA